MNTIAKKRLFILLFLLFSIEFWVMLGIVVFGKILSFEGLNKVSLFDIIKKHFENIKYVFTNFKGEFLHFLITLIVSIFLVGCIISGLIQTIINIVLLINPKINEIKLEKFRLRNKKYSDISIGLILLITTIFIPLFVGKLIQTLSDSFSTLIPVRYLEFDSTIIIILVICVGSFIIEIILASLYNNLNVKLIEELEADEIEDIKVENE